MLESQDRKYIDEAIPFVVETDVFDAVISATLNQPGRHKWYPFQRH